MSIIGGEITEIKCSHPDLGDLSFKPISGEEATINRGGVRTEDDDEARTSGGEAIDKMNSRNWFVEVPIGVDFQDRDDQDLIDQLNASTKEADWTFSHISGSIYSGKGKPKGSDDGNMGTARMDLKVSGSGKLEKIE